MKYKVLSFAAIAVFILSGCEKELNENTDAGVEEAVITATAVAPGAFSATKVAYTDNYSEAEEIIDITSAWENGDTFTALEINGANVDVVTFTSTGTGASASFKSSGAKSANKNTTWLAVSGNAAVVDGAFVCKYDGQDGSLKNLGKYDYSVVEAKGSNPVFDFSKGTRLTYVMRVLLPEDIKYVEYNTGTTNDGGWKVTGIESKDIKGTASTTVPDAVSTITLTSQSSKGDIVYIALPAINCQASSDNRLAGIIVTIMSSDKKLSQGKVASPDLTGKGGNVGTFNMSSLELMARALPEEAIKLGTIKYEGKSYPLGSWAPFNLGGNVQKDEGAIAGYLYAWGETEPRTSFSRGTYKWVNDGTYNTQLGYKYIGAVDSVEPYIEYCIAGGPSAPTHGPGTFYDIGGTKYDAARVKWGKDWRLPSNEVAGNLMMDGDAVLRFKAAKDTEHKVTITAYKKGTYQNANGFTSQLYGASVWEVDGKTLALYYTPWSTGDPDKITINTEGDQGRFWTSTTDYGTGSPKYWNRAVHTRYNVNNSHYMSNHTYICGGLPIRPVLNE